MPHSLLLALLSLVTIAAAHATPVPPLDPGGDVYKTEGPNDDLIYGTTVGAKTAIMLYIDWQDAPMENPTTERRDKVLGGDTFEKIFEVQSYGKLTYSIDHVHGWHRLPGSHKDYSSKTTESHRTLFLEIFKLYPEVDFLAYDLVMANMPRIGNTAFGERDELAIPYKGEKINVALNIASASPYVLAHEAAHCLGLPDLYSYGGAEGPKNPTGPWDIMSAAGKASGFIGWHRHKLGWMDDGRKTYLTAGTHRLRLAPLDNTSGLSMAVVPAPGTDPDKPSKVYVAEVAQPYRNLGRAGKDTGILVYSVDATLATGMNPVVVHHNGDLLNAPFKPGQTFDADHAPFILTVIEQHPDGTFTIDLDCFSK